MQEVIRLAALPASALDAAAEFHSLHLPRLREMLRSAESLVVVLPPAPRDHADWRRAAARDLAREAAPMRVNVIAGGGEAPIAAMLAYLEGAPGVTGQYLTAHEQGS
ncbi:MAG: hypothetical protein A3J40_03550 [Erythrobacter sp. RIFCSPHIGHO2_12_FULL_63_10]|nr:MAG: hypothetical protein A3J40_03550 [Erythrobacter sp. RIFCSPHIGHO2_12_FULL_63_10]